MLLLLDIGNTHTHLGLAGKKVFRQSEITTIGWRNGKAPGLARCFCDGKKIRGAAVCSVVPKATGAALRFLRGLDVPVVELTHRTLRGIKIDYPHPATIGPDRLANALAVRHFFGAPAGVVELGAAAAFDGG